MNGASKERHRIRNRRCYGMLTIEISSSNRVFGLLAKRQKGYDNLIFDQNIHLPIEHEKFLIKRIKKPFISGHLVTNTGV